MDKVQEDPQQNALMMVININEPLVIGEIAAGFVITPDGEQSVCIKCIREASLEEYVSFVKKHNLEHMITRNIHDKYLYFVEVLD